MAVRFLRGSINTIGAYAVNDFEAMAIGFTDTVYGEVESGGITFGVATMHTREAT